MHIRTFRAASLQEALAEIRQQMGPEAAVLHTRQTRSGLLGWAGRKQVEVTAGLREDAPRRFNPTLDATTATPPLVNPLADTAKLMEGLAHLKSAVDSLREQSKSNPQDVPSETTPSLQRVLRGRGLSDGTANHLVELMQQMHGGVLPTEPKEYWPLAIAAAASMLRIGNPIRAGRGRRRVVALAGPTGVGKTTTIAKLAAGFRLQTGMRVGLITIDTFRLGAVEQLRAYAQIMDLPMEVVSDADQMVPALQRFEQCDLVLIDTAGRSPRDHLHVNQLAELLSRAQPDEVQLVLSATSSPATAERVMRGFAPVEPTGLILSKLDEVEGAAGLLPALVHAAPPLTYLTIGQCVPDDIERADALRLAERLFAA